MHQDSAPSGPSWLRRTAVWLLSTVTAITAFAMLPGILAHSGSLGAAWAIAVVAGAVLASTASGFSFRTVAARLFGTLGIVAVLLAWILAIVLLVGMLGAYAQAVGAGEHPGSATGLDSFFAVTLAGVAVVLATVPGRLAWPAALVAVIVASFPPAVTLLVPTDGSAAFVVWTVWVVHLLSFAVVGLLILRLRVRPRWLWPLLALVVPVAQFWLLTLQFIAGPESVVPGTRQVMVGGVFIVLVMEILITILASVTWTVQDVVRRRTAESSAG